MVITVQRPQALAGGLARTAARRQDRRRRIAIVETDRQYNVNGPSGYYNGKCLCRPAKTGKAAPIAHTINSAGWRPNVRGANGSRSGRRTASATVISPYQAAPVRHS